MAEAKGSVRGAVASGRHAAADSRRSGDERHETFAGTFNIFASHSHEYQELAREFKRSVETVQARVAVNVFISEEMPGGTKWRKQVRAQLRESDIFVLLYPHAGMRLDWCSYELGVFHQGRERPIVCIRNIDIAVPPDITDEWQAYKADAAGLEKFFHELFVKGHYTKGRPIDPEVATAKSPARQRSEQAIERLAQGFARARIRRDYYTQRICIGSRGDQSEPFDLEFDLDDAVVTGDERALHLFALKANTAWSVLQESVERNLHARWPRELAEAVKSVKRGPIPPPFTPFRASDQRIYLPVITRAESVDQQLRRMFLIFVEADPVQMRSLLDVWVPAATMPPLWPPLMRLWMMALRARWDYIVPLFYETRSLGDAQSARQLLEKARQAISTLEREAHDRHLSPMDMYGDVFDESLQRDLDAVERDYAEVRAGLFALEERVAEQLPSLIQRWITNNTKRIRVLAAQFQFLAERLNRPRTETEPSAT